MNDMMYGIGMQRPYAGDLYKVTGMDGANRFPIMANSCAALFDANDDIFYIKSTDSMGTPTIRKFEFVEVIDPPSGSEFITRDEVGNMFEELKGLILNGKQYIQEQHRDYANTKDVERVQSGAKSDGVSQKHGGAKS